MAILVMPASTRAMRLAKSMSSTRFMREMPSTIASSSGSAPPESEVPAPRGTTLMLVLVAVAQDRARPPRWCGQHHGERHAAIGGQRVGLVGAPPLLDRRSGSLRHELLELPDDLITAAKNRLVWFRQGERDIVAPSEKWSAKPFFGFVALNYADVSTGDSGLAICPEPQGTPQL